MSKVTPHSAADGLKTVRERMTEAAQSAGRTANDVTLIAVSKTFSADDIVPVLDAGARVFGENRVQEAMHKWPSLREQYRDAQVHLIGPLQTNKAREAVALFDAIHTLDRPKLARVLAQEFDRQGRAPQVFVQVNTGAEPQKAGVLPADADGFIRQCQSEFGLAIGGLMCIPPAADDPVRHFDMLAGIARRNGLSALSMGMSADYETAIAHGATHVRVGSAIFGTRPQH